MRLKPFALSLLLCTTAQAKPLQGQVTRVSDGDTLWVVTDAASKPFKIRLQGVDAPEVCQPWGKQAREALQASVLRKPVQVDVRARDDFGRSVARVRLQSEDLGAWLVSQGHAWSLRGRWDDGPYAGEQRKAKSLRAGLWAQTGQDAQIEPRQWRKQRGPCTR